jgi:hypothetical protein
MDKSPFLREECIHTDRVPRAITSRRNRGAKGLQKLSTLLKKFFSCPAARYSRVNGRSISSRMASRTALWLYRISFI